ncbi:MULTISPECIES: very short patch repair endonuclease [Erwinia]|uniref:Very short patch repair endonuclease n=1 Tax=Erwinia rhapontici TaxID=55212 RepID=A0ABM7N290_ERWRD|nr:DNA mismatch endonuclease Vsr [Erwinia rhapontici]MCS3607326.1 DNA mismatch endonuclease (patch repair protein) [Erwinia rhapontici]TDT02151.1 T/G mismatch-specific endonuclease [Erwinia rhapontici]BCQ35498.1 very short patch repair endonuclease [Erwinia rhapontici]BCQ40402.1 very short patch repair endonuclease [Erwinia rhapontici]BCQ45666.1 very short patch repair endonuclease [Erwinia rhapontici]
MADVHSSDVRSKNMRAIRTRDTAIEKRLAELLVELGLSYRVQDKSLPGRPDFVLADYQAIIFVHGCFWHRHHCHLFKMPATRTAFWQGKIDSNVARDKRYVEELTASGWRVLLVWECALRGKTRLEEEALRTRLEEWICAAETNGEIDEQGIRVLP